MKIGNKIKAIRKEKHITLLELSKESGVALATLSRIENNKMLGTIKAHDSICKALGVNLADIYKEVENESKMVENVPKMNRAEHFVQAKKAKYELLVANTKGKKMFPIMVTVERGGETHEKQSDPGTEKFLYIFSGSLHVTVGKEEYTLKKGDSLYFDASLPHTLKNPSPSKAEAIYIISS
ncbi:MAG: helix-turn-helix transcriptional regulator [Candidatus Omnitrophica bacterium]|nr:helix-turn-helix transcriptional regulator [Candidatus Omnitrophota bacterium]